MGEGAHIWTRSGVAKNMPSRLGCMGPARAGPPSRSIGSGVPPCSPGEGRGRSLGRCTGAEEGRILYWEVGVDTLSHAIRDSVAPHGVRERALEWLLTQTGEDPDMVAQGRRPGSPSGSTGSGTPTRRHAESRTSRHAGSRRGRRGRDAGTLANKL